MIITEAPAVRSAAASSPQPVSVAIMAALIYELRPFFRSVRARRRQGLGLPVWEFSAGQGRGVAVLTGVGEVAAQRAAARMLTVYRPQVLISLGFGGALTQEVKPGGIILGGSFWDYDPDSKQLREVKAPASPVPVSDLVQHLKSIGLPALAGSLISTPTIISKASHLEALRHLPYPILDLETGLVAVAAASRQIAFLGLRAVTDAAGEEIPRFIGEAMERGRAPGPWEVMAWLAKDPRRIAPLARLWRRSRLAAQRLAQALEGLMSVL